MDVENIANNWASRCVAAFLAAVSTRVTSDTNDVTMALISVVMDSVIGFVRTSAAWIFSGNSTTRVFNPDTALIVSKMSDRNELKAVLISALADSICGVPSPSSPC